MPWRIDRHRGPVILVRMESDADIMRRVQSGEERLFEVLVQRYRERLVRFAVSKLGSWDAAEDVVQETLLAAFQARQSYSSRFAFSTWIWTILLNLTRRTLQRRHRQTQSLAAYAEQGTGRTQAPGPLASLTHEDQWEQLMHWLETIPEDEADAIRLRFLGGLPFEEIAAAMQSSVSGAKARVRRGLLRLAERARKTDQH